MSNPILEKIKKLVSLAQDQEGLPEGEAALKVAQRMMEEHGISMMSILEVEPEVTRYDFMFKSGGRWRVTLLGILADYVGVEVVLLGGHEKNHAACIGNPSKAVLLEYLFDVCSRHIKRLASKRTDKHLCSTTVFCNSAVFAINDKICEMKRSAAQDAETKHTDTEKTNALVFINKERDAITRRVANEFPLLKGARQHRMYTGSADGYAAGKSAPLNNAISSNGRAALQLA